MHRRRGKLGVFGAFRAMLGSRAGVSTVEFAMLAPVILMILAGVVDLGGALRVKFQLSSAATAGSYYALLNADKVSATGGSDLAGKIAAIAASSISGTSKIVTVVVNNGSSTTINGSTATPGGTAANADKCYCPTRSVTSVTWGSAVTCGSVCSAGGGFAGKFVSISVSRPYSPLFTGYGIVTEGNITVRSVVQPQ